ncbi:DMT family transporter [Kutzneria sp. NPDC052558]|uniref:DMT family transporter n=1 Tax=Kutzneria sp. NPDC052558 TaxID=3364121 RepID=UPI0037C62405
MNLLIAVPAAVGGAAFFGLTSALQHRATQQVRQRDALEPGLLVDLAQQRVWLLSLVANAFGVILQWVALTTGPLVLVQPLLVTGLLFGVLFSGSFDRVVLLGAGLCVAGLAAFLLVAQPTGDSTEMTLGGVLPLAIGLAAILAICLAVAAHRPGNTRALALAVAAGVLYGVSAGLAKLAAEELSQGILVLLTHWPIYAVAVCGPLGFLLSQNAFQAERALAPALAVITILDPLVGIGIGILWLGEDLHSGVGPVIGQVLALLSLCAGVFVLSRRAPQAASKEAECSS